MTTFEERKAEIEAALKQAVDEANKNRNAAYEKHKRDLLEAMFTYRPPNVAIHWLSAFCRLFETELYENESAYIVVYVSGMHTKLTPEQVNDVEQAYTLGLIDFVASNREYDWEYFLTETGKRYAAGADAGS